MISHCLSQSRRANRKKVVATVSHREGVYNRAGFFAEEEQQRSERQSPRHIAEGFVRSEVCCDVVEPRGVIIPVF